MVFRKKKEVEEPEEEQEEEEEAQVPEIEPAPKKPLKEKTVVVYEFPQRPVTEEVIDGVLVKYITVAEALTKFVNEEE